MHACRGARPSSCGARGVAGAGGRPAARARPADGVAGKERARHRPVRGDEDERAPQGARRVERYAHLRRAVPAREAHARPARRALRGRRRDGGDRERRADRGREAAHRTPPQRIPGDPRVRREHPRHAGRRPHLAPPLLPGRARRRLVRLAAAPPARGSADGRARAEGPDRRRGRRGATDRDPGGERRPHGDDDHQAEGSGLSARRGALLAWFLFVAACAAVAMHARFTADMSAFLPEAATPAQRLLVGELREGVASRLLLIGIEDADPDKLAALSRALAKRLQGRPEFVYVANGDAALATADREFLFAHRYVLSPGVAPGRFDRGALAAALERGYEALASPAGVLVRRYLPADPTGEFLRVLAGLEGEARPPTDRGVWMSPDPRTALLLVQTAAPGFDLDAQEANLALTEQAFAAARDEVGASVAALERSGPAVFAVRSRDAIRGDVRRLSTIATVIVAGMLLLAFRSIAVLGLAFAPVVTGALAGVAAVALGFGTVHGITLGFGVVLIGEAIDYAIYFYAQRTRGKPAATSFARIWPTLRLGLAVSAASFCAMLFAGFPGLAQLGLFAVVGLVVAAAVTRWVLPGIPVRAAAPAGVDLVARLAPRWRWPLKWRLAALGILTAVCAAVIGYHRPIWDDDLARLNPVPAAEQALDKRLRDALGAPDARWLVVVSGATEDAALEAAEAVAAPLAALVAAKAIAGHDSPAVYLPSARAQAARRAALPDDRTLRESLDAAVAPSPFKPDLFEPFLRDVAAARAAPPLARSRLAGTAFGLKTDALLVHRDGLWYALLPVRGVADPAALASRIAAAGPPGAAVLDIRTESTRLVASYRERALALWGVGLAIIVALLAFHLRSGLRVVRVLAPIAAAVAAAAAILLATGTKLTLFHLVALLLVVGVGSNYALFFEREPPDEGERRHTVFAVAFCAATTALAFGLLAWSQVPVLGMIGATAAIGAVASLAAATLIARGRG